MQQQDQEKQARKFAEEFVKGYYQIISVKNNRPNVAGLYAEQCNCCLGGKTFQTNYEILNSIERLLSFGNMILSDQQYDIQFLQQTGQINILFTTLFYTDDGFTGNICHFMQLGFIQNRWLIQCDIYRTINIRQMIQDDWNKCQMIMQQQQQQQQQQFQ